MSDNVLETVRATVQDLIAPELKTHGVRLDHIERRIDETKHSLEQRNDDTRKSLEHRIDDTKDMWWAEMRALDARMTTIENLIKGLIEQVSMESMLRERVVSLEARMPQQ